MTVASHTTDVLVEFQEINVASLAWALAEVHLNVCFIKTCAHDREKDEYLVQVHITGGDAKRMAMF